MENYTGVEKIIDWSDTNYVVVPVGYSYMPKDRLLHVIRTAVNWSITIILLVGLILISILVYRKHKGENGLWKKILKWDLIFFFIVIAIWCIISFVLWYPRDLTQLGTI